MKKQTKQRLIYVRYILPPVLLILLLLIAFIPTHRYVDAGEAREPISLFALLTNSFEQGRNILFATPNATVGQTAFARVLLTVSIAGLILYAIALAVSIWSMVTALKLFMSDDEEDAERTRTLFITFVPNRIVLTLLEALAIPLTLFPYVMPLIYSYTLAYSVRVNLCAPDALIASVIFISAIAVLSAVAAPYERRFDADVFKQRRAFADSADGKDGEEYESVFGTREEDEGYDELRREQAEKIKKLLEQNKKDGTDRN